MTKRMMRLILTGAIAQGTMGVAAVAASARPGDIVNRGDCPAGSEWNMRGRLAHNHVKVRYQVDSDIPNLNWIVRITKNSTTVFDGSRMANSTGDFEVKLRTVDAVGTDTFAATATNTFTGETCGGSVTI